MRERGLLVGDIGGTKTKLSVVAPSSGRSAPLASATFPSAAYPSLDAIVLEFLRGSNFEVGRAVLGVAGPVLDGRATITNLPWELEEHSLARILGFDRIKLLNDLEAVVLALPALGAEDVFTLHAGEPDPHGIRAVIAPGTGLGEAFATHDGTRYVAHASEGGHADFGPSSELELELLRLQMRRTGHVSWERFCSGSGLPNLYTGLKELGHAREPRWLTERLADAPDPTPVIVEAAMEPRAGNELCVATLETFVSILGAEAGNLALKVMATGGVYLGGGIPPRILPALQKGNLLKSFRRKGRLSAILDRIPVHVITNPDAALLGAVCFGFEANPA